MTMSESEELSYLRSPRAIRERCANILSAVRDGRSGHFVVRDNQLDDTARFVVDVIRSNYPTLDIPYHSRWNHFRAGGVDRVATFNSRFGDERERLRSQIELAITSVLLDAGAGPNWSYHEPLSDRRFSRSEGLAVASHDAFLAGAFTSDSSKPLRADAGGLMGFTAERLARAFQVSDANPLVGLEGRAALLTRLGECVAANPKVFVGGRLGGLADSLLEQADGDLTAPTILRALLQHLGSIWPGRVTLHGKNLGDVWRHRHAGGEGATAGLVPFHKLSQWLTYSLLEPFEWFGVTVSDIDHLTGLPEYRNGGLLLDKGVLERLDTRIPGQAHPPSSELVVEWRALTVSLLDELAEKIRDKLGQTSDSLPLAKVLEGGTWAAGRKLAQQKREGLPPIEIESDGTVF